MQAKERKLVAEEAVNALCMQSIPHSRIGYTG